MPCFLASYEQATTISFSLHTHTGFHTNDGFLAISHQAKNQSQSTSARILLEKVG